MGRSIGEKCERSSDWIRAHEFNPREPRNHADFIWSVADLLRGDYKRSEYGKVILPLTVLRRLDGVLAPTKQRVLEKHKQLQGRLETMDPVLNRITGVQFNNTSRAGLAEGARRPAQRRRSAAPVRRPASPGTCATSSRSSTWTPRSRASTRRTCSTWCSASSWTSTSGPRSVSNTEMGYLYEELIRRFSELSNETAGEHFTPREVVELMVNLLFVEDDDLLGKPGTVKTMLDPACGTGGMLSVSEQYLAERNPEARLEPRGIWLRRLRVWRRVWIRRVWIWLQTWGGGIWRRLRIWRRLWIWRRLRIRRRMRIRRRWLRRLRPWLLRRELLRGGGLSRLFNVSPLRVQPRIRKPFHLRFLPRIWCVAGYVWPGDWNVLSTVGPVLLGRGCHRRLCDPRLSAGRERHAPRTDAGCRRIGRAVPNSK